MTTWNTRIAVLLVAITVNSPGGLARDAEPPLLGSFADNFSLLDTPVPAPEARFEDASGGEVTLGSFAGRVVLLNFWATWCAPCVREMPALDRLQAALGDEGLSVVAVSQDRGGLAVVAPFFAEQGLKHLEIYLDPKGRMPRDFGVRGMPTTFLIDAEGIMVGALEGAAEWDSPEAQALIRHYLPAADQLPVKTGWSR